MEDDLTARDTRGRLIRCGQLTLIYNVLFAFCFLLLPLVFLSLRALFSFLSSEIKVDELRKRQETQLSIKQQAADCKVAFIRHRENRDSR